MQTLSLLCTPLGLYSISMIQEQVSELQGFPFCISGNSLPQSLNNAATVDHEESFMIFGGNTGSNSKLNKIYKYNTDGGQWDEVDTTMSQAKDRLTAIKIKGSIFNSC